MGVRNRLYWSMALVYVIIGVTSVITEDFPCGIEKPWPVYTYEAETHALEFILEAAYGWYGSIPRYAAGLLMISRLVGSVGVGRAGVVHGIKWPDLGLIFH